MSSLLLKICVLSSVYLNVINTNNSVNNWGKQVEYMSCNLYVVLSSLSAKSLFQHSADHMPAIILNICDSRLFCAVTAHQCLFIQYIPFYNVLSLLLFLAMEILTCVLFLSSLFSVDWKRMKKL